MSSIAALPLPPHITVIRQCECVEDLDLKANIERIQLLGTLAKDITSNFTAKYQGGASSNMSSPNHGAAANNYNHVAQSHPNISNQNVDEQFGPFVSGLNNNQLNNVRLRSGSLSSISKPTTQRHTAPSVAIPSAIQRLSQQECVPPHRSGSADNLSAQHAHAHHQHLLAMHASQTCPDIYPRSSDSGYHTPPFTNRRPNTSPPNQNRSHWPAAYVNNDNPQPLTTDPPPLAHQPLTVEIGHFEPESSPRSNVGPLTVHGQGYFNHNADPLYQNSYIHTSESQSMPVQRHAPSTPEEGVLGYQFQRKDRLHQAYDSLEDDLSTLEVENDKLTAMIKDLELQLQCEDLHNFDNEIQNMTQENQKLAIGIQALLKVLPEALVEFQQQPAVRPTVSIQAGLPAGLSNPYRRNTAPPRPTPPSFPTYPYIPQAPVSAPAQLPSPPRRMGPRASDADADEIPDTAKWSCSFCTLLNHPLINVCEACERPRKHRVQGMLSFTGV